MSMRLLLVFVSLSVITAVLLSRNGKKIPVKPQIEHAMYDGKPMYILLYQMPKVGSMSVFETLKRMYGEDRVMHLHSHRDQLGPGISEARAKEIRLTQRKVQRALDLWEDGKAYLKVISPVREPVTRNVSAFFHYTGDSLMQESKEWSAEQLQRRFLDSRKAHKNYDRWYDRELLTHLGVDVFSRPFPEAGVASYHRPNLDLLIYRLEVADSVKEEAIAALLGLDKLTLERRHVGDDKRYAKLYRQFKDEVKLPTTYLDEVCSTRYFKHFYGSQARGAIDQRWGSVSER